MKKMIVVLLITIVSMVIFYGCESYDDESNFIAEPIDGSSVKITEYIGSSWTVRIPPRIRGMTVTEIGRLAFEKCQLVSVTIPSSL